MPLPRNDNQAVLLEPSLPRGVLLEEVDSHMPEERTGSEGLVSRMQNAVVVGSGGNQGTSRLSGMPRWCSRRNFQIVYWAFISALSLVAMTYLYSRSWFVLVRYGASPCDVPLARVMRGCLLLVPTYLGRTYIWRLLCKLCGRAVAEGDETANCHVMVLGFACFCLAYYSAAEGMELLQAAQSCKRTAPYLYAWASYMFPSGMAQFIVLHAVASCSYGGLMQAVAPLERVAHKGVDPGTVAALETVETDALFQCSVCLEGSTDGRIVKAMPCCRNFFHLDCLQTWLRAHRTCPLCRADLRETLSDARQESSTQGVPAVAENV